MNELKNLTDQELTQRAANYDNAFNEGGDGCNPFREELANRSRIAEKAIKAAEAATPKGRIKNIERRIEIECGSIAMESGDPDKVRELRMSLRAEIEEIEKEIEQSFVNEWTLETTKARRAEWNQYANTELKSLSGTPRMWKAVLAKEKEQGWTMEQLKKAVKLHGIQ
jgi:vacuolar-type H+-ATPase subunit I/STV1